MRFQHSDEIWSRYPGLAAGVVHASGVTGDASVDAQVEKFGSIARTRLADGPEAEFPEIRAWRRTFTSMGLKATQYRCASESLLRRFRKEGTLPRIHPVIDLCNAVSVAFAIPVGVFDVAEVAGSLEVRTARGDEEYLTFGGATERPEPGEVIFADEAGNAHARRWTNRQSGRSAVRPATSSILVVTEGMHDSAAADVAELVAVVADELARVWPVTPRTALLSASAPRFDLG
ncbi:B3/B4 domain-containing protein [Spirillospora sp. CA-294931]|uniref:B3/B4 domain-containing protein n=1 Tax=Spirillospora sp. CA-294931 TaxID=3240042 RepID=UPI003D93CD9E